jgi:hypothetical protein
MDAEDKVQVTATAMTDSYAELANAELQISYSYNMDWCNSIETAKKVKEISNGIVHSISNSVTSLGLSGLLALL